MLLPMNAAAFVSANAEWKGTWRFILRSFMKSVIAKDISWNSETAQKLNVTQ